MITKLTDLGIFLHMNDQEREYADYTVDEWVAIFIASMATLEEYKPIPQTPFEFVTHEVMNMSNYSNWPDQYFGFAFMETLRYVYTGWQHDELEYKPSFINVDEFLDDRFMIPYLTIVHMDPLQNYLNWGTSIRGAWIDYHDVFERCQKGKFTILGCGLVKEVNGDQINPILKTVTQHKTFFSALLRLFDEYVGLLGMDRYNQIRELFYTGNFNNWKSVDLFYPEGMEPKDDE